MTENNEKGLKTETSITEVVFPSMVNQYGTLFGGNALQWMDKAAWICATRFSRKMMVTIASDRVEFKRPVIKGDMVELCARVKKVGRTSVTIDVFMYSEKALSGKRELATKGEFVMVAVNDQGQSIPVIDQ